ncbi:MAG: beta-galactosidase [Oscillospiraceae bacterium]|nr:beta-galactosidase [Oscillospiraceae bacterium]
MSKTELRPEGTRGCKPGYAHGYIFGKSGGEIYYQAAGKITADSAKYFIADIENKNDFSARLEINFYKKLKPAEDIGELANKKPDFSITTGVLPFVRANVEIPLTYLDGQRLFGERRRGILKTVINGTRMDLEDIAYIGISCPRCHTERNICVYNVQLTDEPAPAPDFSFDTLIDEFGQWNQKDWEGKTHSLEELKTYLDGELAKAHEFLKDYPDNQDYFFGEGDADYEATGYFRIEKPDENADRFIMVTPDGREFFGFGCDCVGLNVTGPLEDGEQHNFLQNNLEKVWGSEYYENWCILTKYRLLKWGVNTVAAWSDVDFARKYKLPYVTIFNGYPGTEAKIYRDFPDVFSEEFQENAAIYAQKLKEFKDDPYLIGYFMSNEPNWAFVSGLNLGYELFISPKSLKSKKYLVRWLKQNCGTIKELNKIFGTKFKEFDAVLEADINTKIKKKGRTLLGKFSKLLIREYIKTPALELKNADVNHLNLGIRYAYISTPDLFQGCEYLDVFSINCYENYCNTAVMSVYEHTKMPVMVGEFHFGALDTGLPATGIGGVENQKERGKAVCAYLDNAKHTGVCVGAHYFQLNDQPYLGRFDGENYNIGLVDICGREYEQLTEIMQPVKRIPRIFF